MLTIITAHAEEPLHARIARQCVRKIRKNGDDIQADIGFLQFITNSHTGQWLPQVQRVVSWICTILVNDPKAQGDYASACQLLGCNIHSLHLVSFFREEYENAVASAQLQLHQEELSGMLPSYLAVVADSSISKQELILQQCIQGSELSWEDMHSLGLFSLEFLCTLVEAYFQPLKILCVLPPATLFHLLESATKEKYPIAISILEASLTSFISGGRVEVLVYHLASFIFSHNVFFLVCKSAPRFCIYIRSQMVFVKYWVRKRGKLADLYIGYSKCY